LAGARYGSLNPFSTVVTDISFLETVFDPHIRDPRPPFSFIQASNASPSVPKPLVMDKLALVPYVAPRSNPSKEKGKRWK
jgi:hypothetical protein